MLFKPTRPDGRSYRDVAVDFFKDKAPETILTYAQIADALDIDDPKSPRIKAIVRSAIKPMLKLYKRGLKNVPKRGYRVIPAREHMLVSDSHRSKADRAIGRAMIFLNEVKRDEMTDMERRLHDGQLVTMQAVFAMHQHFDRRMSKIEDLLKGGKTIEQD